MTGLRMGTNAVRPTPVPQLGEGTLTFDRTFSRGCDPFYIDRIYCREDSYGQEEETEIFARRRHGSEARDAPLQARKGEERQGRKRRQGEKPQTGDRHRAFKGTQEGQKSPPEEKIAF